MLLIGVAVVFVAAVVAFWAWPRYIKPELEHIVSDLSSTVVKLETFIDAKTVQITDHLAEIALQKKHVDVKTSDRERATRIRDKLNELLS